MSLISGLFGLLLFVLLVPITRANPAELIVGFEFGSNGQLVVDYHIPPGLNQIRLPEDQAVLRQEQWHLMQGAATLGDEGFQLAAHSHTIRIEFSAEAVTKAPDRVYPLVIPLGHGGVVINTAAFVPVNACQRTILHFTPRRGSHIVLRGSVHTAPVSARAFCSKKHDGGYVYMGSALVAQYGTFLLVTDPDAPSWIVHGVREALQKALSGYGNLLGLKLQVHPTVYVSFSSNEPGVWYHGDVLAFDTVRLSFIGKPWLLVSSAASNLPAIQTFVAHEAFHFWNGGIKPEQATPHGAWLAEGGAQLAAMLTALRAGWLTSANFLYQLNGDLQRCLLETHNRPWAALDKLDISGGSYYDCGVTFNFMAAVLDNPDHPRQGFFRVWHRLLSVKSSTYSTVDFLDVTAKNARDASVSKHLEKMIVGTTGTLSESIERLLTSLRISVQEVRQLTSVDLPKTAVLARFVSPLLQAACKAPYHYGFWTRKGYIQVDVPRHCKAFSQTKRLVAVGDFKLATSPLAAWNKAYAECRRAGVVTFTVPRGQPLSVPCSRSVSKPPQLLRLGAYHATLAASGN